MVLYNTSLGRLKEGIIRNRKFVQFGLAVYLQVKLFFVYLSGQRAFFADDHTLCFSNNYIFYHGSRLFSLQQFCIERFSQEQTLNLFLVARRLFLETDWLIPVVTHLRDVDLDISIQDSTMCLLV